MPSDTEARIAEIKARLEWMADNYEGCDWCCGGGDDEYADLTEELTALEGEEST